MADNDNQNQNNLGLQFEDILPWGTPGGDTGLSSRLKLKRNFEKILARFITDQGRYLSKVSDDTAQGMITFLRGLQVGERFVTGLLGEGGVFRVEDDGTTYIEADKLYIRMKAYFDSVEIREYHHTGGNRIASVAGARCCRVEWIDSQGNVLEKTQANLSSVVKFRCYFMGNDGEDEVRNNWVVGDLAYCHITTVEVEQSDNPEAKGLNMHHYWRKVVGRNATGTLTVKGEHWIDLSNVSGEYQSGSDVPVAQDDIIQLGNVSDGDRQGAIIEFVTGANAPSYQIFQHINSFSLDEKNFVNLGYDSQNNTAQAYIGTPNPYDEKSTYIWYHNVTVDGKTFPRLDIKAAVSLQSTFGGKSFQELVADYAPEGWTEEEICNLIVDETDDQFNSINTSLQTIQKQVDGAIETWFYDGTPSATKPPEAQWKAKDEQSTPPSYNERLKHLGDLYYDNLKGYAYRYSNKGTEQAPVFEWKRIEDTDVVKALADASKAQDTADHKRRIFVTAANVLPTPPYSEGDMWVNATYNNGSVAYSNEILKCNQPPTYTQEGKLQREGVEEGETPSISHWEKASKYTDDTALNSFVDFTYNPNNAQLHKQIDGKIDTFFTKSTSNPASGWTDAQKESHVDDVWYQTDTDRMFRYIKTESGSTVTYSWDEIFDELAKEAYRNAAKAQDTADGKRRVFVSQPAPVAPNDYVEYDIGDLWVNATYTEQGTKVYDNDLLRCKVAKPKRNSQGVITDGGFSINDWELATKYGTEFAEFVSGTYKNFVDNISQQVDQKSETWYQDKNPLSYVRPDGWKREDNSDHIGDMWFVTADIPNTNYKKGTTWIFQYNETKDEYYWGKADVPQEVFDYADGKCAIYTNNPNALENKYPTNYHKNDFWILGGDANINGVACKQGEVLVAKTDSATYSASHWERKLRYTGDEAFDGYISALLNGQGATSENARLAAATQKAISDAMGGGTVVDGGLLLTSLIAMRKYNGTGDKTDIANYTTWAGISGMYDDTPEGQGGAKGHGIAAWYGGGMIDHEASPTTANYAKSLFRFDGTGYLAGGNLTWDTNGTLKIGKTTNSYNIQLNSDGSGSVAAGNISWTTGGVLTIQGNSIAAATELKVAGSDVLTQTTADARYVTIDWFRSLFRVYNSNDTELTPNGSTTGLDSIKAMVGFWTESYISALGPNSGGGGTSLNEPLLSINQAGLSAPTRNGSVLVFSGGTWKYSSNTGILTSNLTVTGSVTASSITSANGFIVGGKNNTYVLLAGGGTKLLSEIGGGYTLPAATISTLGGVKVNATFGSAASVQESGNVSSRNYGLQIDSNGKAFVYVPWEDHTYTSIPRLSQTALADNGSLSTFYTDNDLTYTARGGGNTVTDKPSGVDAFGVLSFKTAGGYHGQIMLDAGARLFVRSSDVLNGGWIKMASQSWVSEQGYITGITSSMVTSALGFTPAASSDLSNYLPKSGGVLTGNVYHKSSTLERGVTPTTRTVMARGWYDKNNKNLGWLEFVSATDGQNSVGLFVLSNTNTTTTDEYGGLKIFKKQGVSGNYAMEFNANTGNLYTRSLSVGSDALVSNLNADYLDGHNGSYYATASSVTTLQGYFTGGVANQAACIKNIVMASGDDYEDPINNYTSVRGSFIAVNLNSLTSGVTLTDLGAYDTLVSFGYNTRTIQFKGAGYSDVLKYRRIQLSNNIYSFSGWKTIAFTDSDITGNAASATKLQTPRTIWGQSFNGTQDITDGLTVTSGGITIWESSSHAHDLYIGWCNDILSMYCYENSNFWDMVIGTSVEGVAYGGLYFDASTSRWGIGTKTPSYTLDVVGNVRFGSGTTRKAILGSNANYASLTFVDGSNNNVGFLTLGGAASDSDVNVLRLGNGGYSTVIRGKDVNVCYGNSDTWALYVNTSGNVGIGTTSPSTKLTVDGKLRVNTTAESLTLAASSGTYNCISYTLSGYNSWSVGINSSNRYYFWNNNASSTILQITNTGSVIAGSANGTYIQIGGARIVWNNSENSLYVVKSDGSTAANFYATGGLSALGSSSSSTTYLDQATADARYLKLSGGQTMTGSFSGTSLTLSSQMKATNAVVTAYLTVGTSSINTSYTLYVGGNAGIKNIVIGNEQQVNTVNCAVIQTLSSRGIYIKSGSAPNYVDGTWANASDIRLKDIVSNAGASVEQVADAPVFNYKWKAGGTQVMLGTSAQYWRNVFNFGVNEGPDSYLYMDYASIALASAVMVARKVQSHEERIAALEAENTRLQKEINELKAA